MALGDELVLAGDPKDDDEEEEEELQDPYDTKKTLCQESAACDAAKEKLQECTVRVNSRKNTEETCEEELFDFLHCVDHCVAKNLFSELK